MFEKLNPIFLERSQFYDELWSFTGQELRIRYALSPFSLQQLCQQHRLPVPPAGYWTKLRHGKKAKPPPLPSIADPALGKVFLLLNDPGRCRLRCDPVIVSATLDEPHTVV